MPQREQLSPQQVMKDPNFIALPGVEKIKVLKKIDPSFDALPVAEQAKVIDQISNPKKTLSFGNPIAVQRGTGVQDDKSAVSRALMGIGRAGAAPIQTATSLLQAAIEPPTEQERAEGHTSRGPGMFLHRTIVEPAHAEQKHAEELAAEGERGPAYVHSVLSAIPVAGPTAGYFYEGFRSGDVAGTAAEFLTLALLPKLMRKLPEEFMSQYRPKLVEIEGTKFVVPAGEAAESPTANKYAAKQAQYKKAGIGAQQFDEINRYNQQAAREVIRKVAQKTAGMTNLPTSSPAGTTGAAGDYVLAQAKPMYQALDQAIQGTPAMRVITKNMSEVVEQAIAKAEKYGAPPMAKGSTAPGLKTPPLETYLQARSFLLDTIKKTRDPLARRGMQMALDEMNDSVEKAMKSSGVPDMYQNFQEANALWAKGKALQRVGESMQRATPGVPTAKQNPGLTARPPAMKSATLANQLNKLDSKGDLTRAFGKDGSSALFKVADLLDRQSDVGLPAGEQKLWHDLRKLTTGPYQRMLVKVMTTPQGQRSILDLAKAYTPQKASEASAVFLKAVQQANQVQPPPQAQQ